MKMIFKKTICSLSAVWLIMAACDFNHGIAPLPGTLKVRVIYRGTAPANTQGIYLVVAPVFPPHAINELYHSPNSLPFLRDTVYTEMDLPYGHYDSYALWWYSKDTKSNLADILAMPLDASNSLLPASFDITDEKPVVEKTLYANLNRLNRPSAIKGTIYFNGPFPSNTLATAIAAFKLKPEEGIHFLLYLRAIDFSIEENPYHFNLPIQAGGVDYIAVFWLAEHAALTDFKTVGIYLDPADPTKPGRLNLKEGETIEGVDIHADWSAAVGK
jgi:hypothetical protein